MVYILLLFLSVAASWFTYLYIRRKESLIDTILLSVSLAIGLPLLLLTTAAMFSIAIDIYSIIFAFIISVIPPLALYGSHHNGQPQINRESSLLLSNTSKDHHRNTHIRSLETLLSISFLFVAFVIISIKWAVPAEMDSFIQPGLDPARLAEVSPVIVATGSVPPIDYVIHTDPGTTATGNMPAQQILNAIVLIVDKAEISDILEYEILFFISVGTLSIFGITYEITRKPVLAGIAAVLFASAITNFNPLPSIITVYALFPLFIFVLIKYIQNNSKLHFSILFITVGVIFVTYHGGALMTAFVLIVANIIAFVKASEIFNRKRIAYALIAVTVWFAIIPVFYMFIFETSFSHFVEFFTGYWQIRPISEARSSNQQLTDTFFPLLYVVGVVSLFSFCVLQNRLTHRGRKFSSTYSFSRKIPTTIFISTILYLLSGFVIGILIISFYQGGKFGDGIVLRMSRPESLAFLPLTALAFFPLFRISKEQFFRDQIISAWFATLIIGIAIHSFGLNTNEAAFERTVDLTQPVVAIFASLAIGKIIYSSDKTKLKRIAVVGLTPLLFTLAMYLSFDGLNKYYHPAVFPDFIMHMEDFKRTYSGEVTLYDYYYVNDFIHLEPDIYIENITSTPERAVVNTLKDNHVTYIISRGYHGYWDNVLEMLLDNDHSVSSYEKIVDSKNIVIYKINR